MTTCLPVPPSRSSPRSRAAAAWASGFFWRRASPNKWEDGWSCRRKRVAVLRPNWCCRSLRQTVAWPPPPRAYNLPPMTDAVEVAPTLLVVEDDALLRERLVRACAERGFVAQGAASVAEARRLAEEAPEYAVVDLRIGDESGLEVIR